MSVMKFKIKFRRQPDTLWIISQSKIKYPYHPEQSAFYLLNKRIHSLKMNIYHLKYVVYFMLNIQI